MTRAKFFRFLAVLFTFSLIFYIVTARRASPQWVTGIVDANQVIVNPQITARIDQLLVKEGDHVHAGQLIAVLDASTLEAQLAAAQAATQMAEARHVEASANTAITASSLPERLRQARAQLSAAQAETQQARATLQQAQADFERIEPLAQQGILSRQALDDARAKRDSAEAAVVADQQRVDAAQAAVADAAAQLQQVQAQRANTRAMLASAKQARAQAQRQQAELAYTRVVAPISGVIGLRVARQGEVVTPGSAIVTIIELDDTWVQADVEETYSDRIALGRQLDVRLPSGRTIAGKVTYKAAEGDFATARDLSRTKRDIRAVAIRVSVPNPDEALVPGMTAYVLIPQQGH